MKKPMCIAAVLLLCVGASGRAWVEDDPWADLRFLMGEWEGENVGAGPKGSFTLAPDLDGKVLIRKNRAEIPAQGNRPAAVHEDLMVIYPETGGKGTKAIYFDNEGHVIQYAMSVASDKRSVTFLSEASAPGPRFRLSYIREQPDLVGIRFEIAPPGGPATFRTYLEGKVKKRAGAVAK
jgi:hypothetical protein